MTHQVFELGYDVRGERNTAKDVLRHLLRQPDDDLYSADYLFWPSLWATCLRDAEPPEFVGPTQQLWADYLELLQYSASAMAERACEAPMFIAVDVFVPENEPDSAVDLWRGRSELVEPVPDAGRTLLGYDVGDVYLGSWLDSDDPLTVWRSTFGERDGVTRNGLLIDEADAHALADAMQDHGKADWYVYRLWRIH